MGDLATLYSLRAIDRLLADYCHLVDDRRLDEWAELFEADATLSLGPARHEGRTAIEAWIRQATERSSRPSRHLVMNSAIDLVTPDTAICTSDYLVVSPDGTILAVGRYHDEVATTDGSWRFRHRTIHIDT